jgi:predicted nucleic-acid-binding Zn-ribbon protein
MDDSQKYARFAAYLDSKKAGPLVCPICKATESFEAKGTLGGARSRPLTSTDPQLEYASCTNCGYSIIFDTGRPHLPG